MRKNTNYEIEYVCNKMLDNADLAMDLSAYPNIVFDFFVYGTVDEKFWKVVFQCNRTIDFKIENESDRIPNNICLMLVLETSATAKKKSSLKADMQNRAENSQPEDTVWAITIYGDMLIQLVCCDFTWELLELSESEYNARCDSIGYHQRFSPPKN